MMSYCKQMETDIYYPSKSTVSEDAEMKGETEQEPAQ